MIPHTSFFSEIRRLTKQGTSFGVTLPTDFVKSLETLNVRNLRLLNLNNMYVIYFPEKSSINDHYDLLQLVLTAIEALNTISDDEFVKEKLLKVYEELINLQEVFDEELREDER